MNRIVAVSPATLAAVNAVQATASQLNSRRVTFPPSAGFAAGGGLTAGAAFLGGAPGISLVDMGKIPMMDALLNY